MRFDMENSHLVGLSVKIMGTIFPDNTFKVVDIFVQNSGAVATLRNKKTSELYQGAVSLDALMLAEDTSAPIGARVSLRV
jgi:hypothetical protein